MRRRLTVSVLYLTARNASTDEILECVENLSKMGAKEKALTCAALIAFFKFRNEIRTVDRSLLTKGKTNVNSNGDEEVKTVVLQKLSNELDDNSIAFSHLEDNNLELAWEENFRKELYAYMKFPRQAEAKSIRPIDWKTARHACRDLYGSSLEIEKENAQIRNNWDDSWNNSSKELPTDFLCAFVLRQATCEQSLWSAEVIANFPSALNEEALLEKLESAKRDAVINCFKYCQTSLYEKTYKSFENMSDFSKIEKIEEIRRNESLKQKFLVGECIIMNAFLRTQFIATRLGIGNNDEAICGDSSSNDVLVSEIVQNAIAAISNEVSVVKTISSGDGEFNEDGKEENEVARASLLETIRKNANKSQFFSFPLFIQLYETIELQTSERRTFPIYLAITYDSFRPFGEVYEIAKNANHLEIKECLNVFDKLSPKEKAFVLASVTLYIVRSERTGDQEKTWQRKKPEPLSPAEKKIFAQIVRECESSVEVVFKGNEGTIMDWESSFRKNALEFQKTLGKRNPYYAYSIETNERWEKVCNEAPIVLLYSMLAMETRFKIDESGIIAKERNDPKLENVRDDVDSVYENTEENSVTLEINMTRCYLCLTMELASRKPYSLASHSVEPSPRIRTNFYDVKLGDIARNIEEIIPL